MLNVSCPQCSSKMQAPKELVGRKAICGKCGHKFTVEPVAESDAYAMDEPEPLPSEVFDPVPMSPTVKRLKVGSATTPSSQPPIASDSGLRYPWLTTYLGIIRTIAKVAAIVGLIATAFCLLGGILGFIYTLRETHTFGLELISVGLVLGLATIGQYIATVASVEFIRVIIDIEQSVRALADLSRNAAGQT